MKQHNIEKVKKLLPLTLLMSIIHLNERLYVLFLTSFLGFIVFNLHWNNPQNGIIRKMDILIVHLNIIIYFYFNYYYKSKFGMFVTILCYFFFIEGYRLNNFKHHFSGMILAFLSGIIIIINKKS